MSHDLNARVWIGDVPAMRHQQTIHFTDRTHVALARDSVPSCDDRQLNGTSWHSLAMLLVIGSWTLLGCSPQAPTTTSPTATSPTATSTHAETASAAPANAPADPVASPAGTQVVPPPTISDQVFWDAALKGDKATVRAGLAQGINVNAADAGGRTALMLASFDGHEDLVAELLEHDPQVDRRDTVDRTALHYASSGENPGVVNKLLKAGASVDLADNQESWTALMFAAAEGNVEVVRLLLQHGADPTLRDSDGETALQFAANNGHEEVVKLLSTATAK